MKAIAIEPQTTFRKNYNVIVALIIRELKTRFGKERLGILWSFIEPTAHVLLFSAIWHLRGSSEVYGISVMLFILTGVLPYNYFSALITRSMNCVGANRGLFSFRQVKPIHALISRWILETGIFVFVYLIFALIGLWFGIYEEPRDMVLIFISYLLLSVLGSGFGLTAAVTVVILPETEKMIPLVMRPLYFLSGIFFASQSLPDIAVKYLAWNPVLCAIDLARYGYLGIEPSRYISIVFLAFFAFGSMMVGLYLYNRYWTKMVGT